MAKIDVLKSSAYNLRDLIVDTVPASIYGSNAIDALKIIHRLPQQLQGKEFYIYSGAQAGEARTIGTLSNVDRRIFFQETFDTIPSTNSNFLILDHFQKAEYDNAIDRMMGIARQKYLEERVATLEIVATQYEYPVPSGFEYVSGLRLVPSGSSSDYGGDDEVDRVFEFHSRLWRVEPNPLGTFLIVLDSRQINLDDFNNEWLHILGQSKPPALGTDNATVLDDLEEYLVAGASMILASQRITENQEWRDKFRMFRDMKNELEGYIHRTRYGKRVNG